MNLNKRQKSAFPAHGHVLDLLDPHNLQSMGLSENQLWGPIGGLSLETIKNQSKNIGFQYCAYRDPLRPGLLWVENLTSQIKTPWKSFESAKLAEKLCPGLVESWNTSTTDPLQWEMVYPPITTPHLDYCTVLEWLIQKYPHAVVAWVELALTYENDLKLHCALENLFKECEKRCSHYKVVEHVLGIERTSGFRT